MIPQKTRVKIGALEKGKQFLSHVVKSGTNFVGEKGKKTLRRRESKVTKVRAYLI
jgi:hypothetical protein